MNETNHSRLRTLSDPDRLPALKPDYVHRRPALGLGDLNPPPRILLLYGSLRERSYSRLRSEEHTSELQSLMRISYAVFCLKKKTYTILNTKPSLLINTTPNVPHLTPVSLTINC